MSVLVYRIDDRLIHGQVVIGWGRPLGIEFIALVDAQVFGSEWERDLYRMGVPPEMELIFADVPEAARLAAGWREDPRAGMVLTADVGTMAALRQAAPPIPAVNIGGVHHRPGRSLRLPYVYLTDDEFRMLQAVEAAGTEITAQDLPNTPPVPLSELA